jgi:predicted metal-binding membrane protein
MGGMAISMAAMMAPTAAPFFVAFGRDTRRPAAVAAIVAVYLTVWAVIGAAAGLLMSQVMIQPTLVVGAVAVGLAAIYMLTPWSRWAQARCRAMCAHEPRAAGLRGALVEGSTYAGCCVICSAGVMAVLVVLGTSSILLMGVAGAVLLVYKLI